VAKAGGRQNHLGRALGSATKGSKKSYFERRSWEKGGGKGGYEKKRNNVGVSFQIIEVKKKKKEKKKSKFEC